MRARLVLAVLLFSSFAVAQTGLSPSVDIFAGYSFVSIGTKHLIIARGERHGRKPENCGEMLREPQQVSLQQLGIQGDAAAIYGFRITAIARGSAAEKAGLAVGDYIVSVNCVKVHTANELVTALSRVDGTAILAINKPTSLPDQTEIRRLEVGP
jgi:membrane-associated protease RseP (regulator of RpoE activity)